MPATELQRTRRDEECPEDGSGNASHTVPEPPARRNSQTETESRYSIKIGIYGWRKRCLYVLILGLVIVVIVNLALTLWVLKVMEFSTEGMGSLRVVAGGLQLSGQALVLDALRTSNIRSRYGQAISIKSSRNFSINTRDQDGLLENRIFLGNDRLDCLASGFTVTDTRGSVLFSVDKKKVVVGSDSLRVTGEGGALFSGSVQTPLVRAESGHELRLESPTRTLELRAPLAITMESRAGDLSAICLSDLKLQSTAGAIRMNAPSIVMTGLKVASLTMPLSSQTRSRAHDIYQLCVCANGKLFLAQPHGICAVDETGHVCQR